MKLKIAITLALLFSFNAAASSIVVASDVVADTRWEADTVYIEKRDFTVWSGARLTIAPGTVVKFRGGARFITVRGTITAVGTERDSICFSNVDPNIIWQGIRILGRSRIGGRDSSFLSYCKLIAARSIGTEDSLYMRIAGALYVGPGNHVELSKSTILRNRGRIGGAVYADTGSSVRLSDCHFMSNTAETQGGGAIMTGDGGRVDLFIENSRFEYNYARRGGAVRIGRGTVAQINSCVFYRDSTVSINPEYGALGGALAVFGPSDVTVRNSIFLFNRSYDKGGAIYSSDADIKLINCTIAQSASVYGGGIYFAHSEKPSSPQLTNSIVSGGTLFWVTLPRDSAGASIFLENNVTPSFRHCVVFDTIYDHTIKPYMGEFINSRYGLTRFAWGRDISDTIVEGYYLRETAWEIDKGTPDTTGLGLPEYDILGNKRIIGPAIDIGAFEYTGEPVSITAHFAPSTNVNGRRLSGTGVGERTVYSISGKRLAALGAHESVDSIRNRLPKGVYFVVQRESGRKISSKRVVVR